MKDEALNPQVIAIFDLDYTLTKRGTWGRFVWESVRDKPIYWFPLFLSTLSFQLRYKLGKIPRGAVKKTMMRWSLMKSKRPKLEALANEFADKEVSFRLRPGGIAALEYHKKQGHEILIASAAVDLVVRPIAQRLGVTHFVSTQVNWSKDDELEKEFSSPNCYGEEKLICVKQWLNTYSETRPFIYFYTDSKADLPVLEFSDIPVVVDPKNKFKKIAECKGFSIQSWRDSADGFVPINAHH